MLSKIDKRVAKWHVSIYLGFVVWGMTAYSISPTVASFFSHIVLTPIALAALIAIARFEGRHS